MNKPYELQPCPICGVCPDGMDTPCDISGCPNNNDDD
jgi:hypothetical protein